MLATPTHAPDRWSQSAWATDNSDNQTVAMQTVMLN